jgi:hypothetical protein
MEKPNRGRGDDLNETLQAFTAKFRAATAKIEEAKLMGDPAGVSLFVSAFGEMCEAAAAARSDLEADLKQAEQLGDLPRCLTIMSGLRSLEPMERAIADLRNPEQPPVSGD